jgi:hypothetical protein
MTGLSIRTLAEALEGCRDSIRDELAAPWGEEYRRKQSVYMPALQRRERLVPKLRVALATKSERMDALEIRVREIEARAVLDGGVIAVAERIVKWYNLTNLVALVGELDTALAARE